ncbi:hypothetical protein CcaverHIS002_0500850 [Cutaneotrichosporon cavernicola]|uniref:Myb-like domain-containing protein n=1 Tax=Cutaneotrichosporon cavernicola TaxID=279322 RepID=A0AA48L838_9TREE|nr:uncharacterized protein CcaverHIS019_0600850 [Cutaneotrichosporon cavernicola]BEI84684.1 hypothetical protein CcaverHIS002_0500850 [Cutaneotrichosporon cavernicola]BEI93626.1 hypothetical protein CcaverHIS019_0600850 [Cutaneotrichosporon cavernicola]BEJ01403.1 hypothetical protein CcaverHIS631_0600850 [Cutaneotrichosporon cavernicola]BEJ09170.1 hypothetical protein CcaverHIS641_0600850 [Cutaneotrichosporon cavernicola]
MPHTRSVSPAVPSTSQVEDVKPILTKTSNKNLKSRKCDPDSDEDTKPPKRSRTTTTSNPVPRNRPWTADDYLALFEAVTKHGAGAKAFSVVPGRTVRQAAGAWRDVVGPACREALVAKAAKRR